MDHANSMHSNEIIAEHERRGPFTMALLWITMVTCFPSVLIGFEWFKQGFSLSQVVICTIIGAGIILGYTVPVAHLAAKTGKSFGMLNEFLFGRKATNGIHFALLFVFISFYGIAALLLADALNSMFHWTIPPAPFAAGIALLMALNNFFGFKGIANFARFLAAPVIIAWVSYTFIKTAAICPSTVLVQPGTATFAAAITTITSFIIGFAVWGNEADYWRYGKAKVHYSAIPLAIALSIGEVIFPVTGWMVAHKTGITDFAAATAYMNEYSFGGVALFGALVLFASYFAANDSNLFGSAAALELTCKLRHRIAVAILAVLGMITAAAMSLLGAAQAVESICSVNCVILPVATLIVTAEWFLSTRGGRAAFSYGGNSRAAVIALVVGVSIGVLTSGALPGLKSLHVGLPWLQSWLLALVTYIPLRMMEYRKVSQTIAVPAIGSRRTVRRAMAKGTSTHSMSHEQAKE